MSSTEDQASIFKRADLRNVVAAVFIGIFVIGFVYLFFFKASITELTISGNIDANVFISIFTGTIIAIFAWLGFRQIEQSNQRAMQAIERANTGTQGEWARNQSLNQITTQIAFLKQDIEWTRREIEFHTNTSLYSDEKARKVTLDRLKIELDKVKEQLDDKLLEREEIVNSPHF